MFDTSSVPFNLSRKMPADVFIPASPTSSSSDSSSRWNPSLSASLYRIDGWGAPYFTANSSGNISVRPHGSDTLPHQDIDLLKVVKNLTDPKASCGLGLQLPLIVRFPDVLLAMSCLCKGNPDAFLICNGFKDSEYVSLALLGRKLELNTVIVLEQEHELDLVIDLSKKMNVRPVIGLRAKLRTKQSNYYGSNSGEKGKFGLTSAQIVRVEAKLRESGMLDCLQLLHFHIGSMIPTTSLLSDGVSEAALIYCELVRLGAHMRIIDVGGGLGIDYDGSKSGEGDISVAYTLEEYAEAVVASIRCVCDRRSVKHPVICSESGRAIVSHHSVLIFEAVKPVAHQPKPDDIQFLLEGEEDLYAAVMRGDQERSLLYVEQLKQRCVEGFKDGVLSIEQLGSIDGLCEWVLKAIGRSDPVQTYNINLSIFTSTSSHWGMGHLFPIVPIHKLDQKPKACGILSDITCDSEGKIVKFIGGESSLRLHEIDSSGRYFLGLFLGGAYEESMGGVYNLFGGLSVVRVSQSDGPHSFVVTRAVPGQSSSDVLRAVQHEPELMLQTLKHRAEEVMHTKGGGEEKEEDDEYKNVAACLDRSFHNMPYLATEEGINE
ncbi:hypothetical protein HID58_040300 [Brassica napus]|uniref:Arginine decarboxylase n=1 Tax=Brassica napus TaxID=3708 RepID=A0ABQ8B7P4_BRANA|nr:hypothetical protein HID58_040300 [Brassica napus]